MLRFDCGGLERAHEKCVCPLGIRCQKDTVSEREIAVTKVTSSSHRFVWIARLAADSSSYDSPKKRFDGGADNKKGPLK